MREAAYSNSPTVTLTQVEAEELGRCYSDPAYFIRTYCYIYDTKDSGWIPFELWPAQKAALDVVHGSQLAVILKARQIGMTWLVLAYALWSMIFRPIGSVLIFSKRDTDAIYLLSEDRLRGMYNRLPEWMKDGHETLINNAHEWILANESAARAFPTSAGDSYTATLAVVDEADLAPDLNSLLRSVKPTIDNGGKMVLLSRADKDKPVSEFKRIYTEARENRNGWKSIFLPWWVHPGRNQTWYEQQKVDIESRTGSTDDLYEQYPATDSEAMQPRELDKRIPFKWLEAVYAEDEGDDSFGMAGLTVYRKPGDNRQYVMGADPAEGNPNSDDSAAVVLDVLTGEEVAVLANKLQPNTFADSIMKLARWYNDASILVERNNHGHAILLKLANDGFEGTLNGFDNRPGWHSTVKGKALMYTATTKAIQDKEVTLHNFVTYQQLASIEASSLQAPKGQHDDQATALALAQCGRVILMGGEVAMASAAIVGRSPIEREDAEFMGKANQGAISRKISSIKTVRVVRTAKRIGHEHPGL